MPVAGVSSHRLGDWRMLWGSIDRAFPSADPLTEDLLGLLIEANVSFAPACELLKIPNERVNRSHRSKEAGRVAGTKLQLRDTKGAEGKWEVTPFVRVLLYATSFVNKVLWVSGC